MYERMTSANFCTQIRLSTYKASSEQNNIERTSPKYKISKSA